MRIIEVFFNFRVLQDSIHVLLLGLWLTILLGLASIAFGMVLGLVVALMRLYAPPFFRKIAIIYIDVMRALPLLVMLVIIYYTLPFINIRLSAFVSATLAIGLVSGAYTAEIFRSGIEAIPQGQFEASKALGLSGWRMMGGCDSAASLQNRHPAADQQCHRRDEGYRSGFGGRHARPPEAGHPGAGRARQSLAVDRRRFVVFGDLAPRGETGECP